jgi:hypothetical protein
MTLQVVAFLLAIAAISAVYATAALALQSSHAHLSLVWNDGQHDCADIPMTLVDNYLWECAVPIAAEGSYYFQFWTGGVDDLKYGADLFDPLGLVLSIDPSAVVVDFAGPGYRVVRLDEAGTAFVAETAPGSILLDITVDSGGTEVPTDLSIHVEDGTSGLFSADYAPGPVMPAQITGLLTGRSYTVTVTAHGYRSVTLSVDVPDGTPVNRSIVLERLVANEPATWGAVKAAYRR